jgi:gluconolactonase
MNAFVLQAAIASAAIGFLAVTTYAADLPAPGKTKTVELCTVPNYCEGVVFDHAGLGYVSEGDTIWRFTLEGKIEPWSKTGAPNGHKILADGSHLVCDASQHAVLRLSPASPASWPASWPPGCPPTWCPRRSSS